MKIREATLWAWGIALVLIGATLSVFGNTGFLMLVDSNDEIIMIGYDYIMTIARVAVIPAGAMVITLAIVVRAMGHAERKSDSE
jgi:Na+-driven multidrug efflux pump